MLAHRARRASGRRSRSRAAAERGGGQGGAADAASGASRTGTPRWNFFPSATMGKADDFSTTPKALEEKYIGLYTFHKKEGFG